MILGEKKNTNKLQLFDHLLFFSPTLDVQIRTIIKQHFKPVQTKESRHQGKTGKRMRKIIKIKKLTSKWLSRYQEHAIFHPYVLLGPISKITNKKQFLSCRKDSNPVMYKNKKSGSSKSPTHKGKTKVQSTYELSWTISMRRRQKIHIIMKLWNTNNVKKKKKMRR